MLTVRAEENKSDKIPFKKDNRCGAMGYDNRAQEYLMCRKLRRWHKSIENIYSDVIE